jgi:uncharacterized protein YbjT (DUF2867 family)
MKILVTGSTGLVGAEVIRQATLDKDITEIVALARRPVIIPNLPSSPNGAKLTTVLHDDFLNYDGLSELFKDCDACLWCLGISQSQVTKEQYHVITYDYAIAAAKAALNANPGITFIFVSGGGADSTEKSKTLFARVKGKTENALKKLPFKRLVIVRPGGIRPTHKNPNTSWVNKLAIPLFPVIEFLAPSAVIWSADLGKAILRLVKQPSDKIVIENPELRKIAGA